MHANVFDFSQVLAASKERYIEFLRVPAFSVGIYVLDGGATDPQKPHTEDEVYYVAAGRGNIRIGSEGEMKTFDVGPSQSSLSRLGCIIRSTTLPRGFQFSCFSVPPRARPFVLRRDKFDPIRGKWSMCRKETVLAVARNG